MADNKGLIIAGVAAIAGTAAAFLIFRKPQEPDGAPAPEPAPVPLGGASWVVTGPPDLYIAA